MRLALTPTTVGNAVSFGVGLAGVALLWGEARDVPSSSGLSGVPSGQVLTGWILGGMAAFISVGAMTQPYRQRGFGGPSRRVTAWDIAFAVLGVVAIGLLAAISPYTGGLALAALAVDVNLRYGSRALTMGERRRARLVAGAHLVALGAGYVLLLRELDSRGLPIGEAGLGGFLALLAPGLRLVAGAIRGDDVARE